MKKRIFNLLALLVLLLALGAVMTVAASAEEATPALDYELVNNRYYKVIGIGDFVGTELTIPATYNGKPVQTIGRYAFQNQTQLTKVVLPDSITNVGHAAFYGCTSLTDVTLSKNTKALGTYMFYGCTSLTEITIPEGVTAIGAHAFRNCTALTTVHLPSTLTRIGQSAFRTCRGLTSFTIPDSVTFVDHAAFYGCAYLTDLTIGSGLTEVPTYAFYNCRNLKNVTLGANIEVIKGHAFRQCVALKSIELPECTEAICSGAFRDCTRLASVTLPEGLTLIESTAFYKCSALASLVVPKSLNAVGTNAFSGCSALKTLYYAGNEADWSGISIQTNTVFIGADRYYYSSTQPLGEGKFWGYVDGVPTVWENATLDYTLSADKTYYIVTGIGNYTGSALVIPDKYNGLPVKEIAASAFRGCTDLSKVTLPAYLKTIGANAFRECTALQSITIPYDVLLIGNNAFFKCSSLTYVVLNLDCQAEIGTNAFSGCSALGAVYFGGDKYDWEVLLMGMGTNTILTSAPRYYYSNNAPVRDGDHWCYIDGVPTPCGNLKYTLINNSYYRVDGIGSYINSRVEIPATYNGLPVKEIKASAFANCKSLTRIILPDSIETIGEGAFNGCTGLIHLYIPDSVVNIASNAFNNVGELNNFVYYENGVYLGTPSNPYLILIKATDKTITSCQFHPSTEIIHSYAFEACSSLTSVSIPSSIKSIGGDAFYLCYNLTSLYISDLEHWCSVSFKGASSSPLYYAAQKGAACNLYVGGQLVTELIIPNTIPSIAAYAFSGCNGLTSVTVPTSVTQIGYASFYLCNNISYVEIPFVGASMTDTANAYFGYIFGVYSTGSSNNLPTSLETIVITGGGTIMAKGFANVAANATVILRPSSTLTIGEYAFQYSNIKSVVLGDEVTTIGKYAFYNCDNLKSIHFGKNADIVANGYPLQGCIALESITVSTENIKYRSEGNCLISGTTLLKGCKNSIIPDGITFIGTYAFQNVSSLGEITIPSSVKTIGAYAFQSSGVTKVSIPHNSQLKTIAQYAFQSSALTDIDIPSSVTEIDAYAFWFNSDKTINVHIVDIDAWCAINIAKTAFMNSKNIYLNGTLLTDVVISNDVTDLNDKAFYGVSHITSVTLPSALEYITSEQFRGCSALTTLIISPNSKLKSIGQDAFMRSALKTIYYGGTVEEWNTISINASNTSVLSSVTIYYYSSTQPTESGNYWHYVDGVPTKW